MAFIQYPWRFLIFASLASSFAAGAVVFWLKKQAYLKEVKKEYFWLGLALFVLFFLLFQQRYFQPQHYLFISVKDYVSERNIKWQTSKISDEYLPKDFVIPQNDLEAGWGEFEMLAGKMEIIDAKVKTHQADFKLQVEAESEVLINLAYFPGWQIDVDGQKDAFVIEGGRPKLILSPGDHQLKLRLVNTPIRSRANLISLMACLIFFGFNLINLFPRKNPLGFFRRFLYKK